DQDQVEALWGFHDATDFQGPEREGGPGELLEHGAGPPEPAEVASLMLRGADRVLPGRFAEGLFEEADPRLLTFQCRGFGVQLCHALRAASLDPSLDMAEHDLAIL